MSRIGLLTPSPFTPLTREELLFFMSIKVAPQGAAPLLPKDSATGSEEGSAAGDTAVSEGASSTSFCLGGTVTSAGVRGEGWFPALYRPMGGEPFWPDVLKRPRLRPGPPVAACQVPAVLLSEFQDAGRPRQRPLSSLRPLSSRTLPDVPCQTPGTGRRDF